jgi:hypothetical protein
MKNEACGWRWYAVLNCEGLRYGLNGFASMTLAERELAHANRYGKDPPYRIAVLVERERLYHVIAVNEKTGAITVCTSSPVTHDEACAIKSKYLPNKNRRIQLSELDHVA